MIRDLVNTTLIAADMIVPPIVAATAAVWVIVATMVVGGIFMPPLAILRGSI